MGFDKEILTKEQMDNIVNSYKPFDILMKITPSFDAAKARDIAGKVHDKLLSERMEYIYDMVKNRSKKGWCYLEYTILDDERTELLSKGFEIEDKDHYVICGPERHRHIIKW
jgi:hypothetical protein